MLSGNAQRSDQGSAAKVAPHSLYAKNDITSQTGGFMTAPNKISKQKEGRNQLPVPVSELKQAEMLSEMKKIDEYLTKQCFLCGDVLIDMIETSKYGCHRKVKHQAAPPSDNCWDIE